MTNEQFTVIATLLTDIRNVLVAGIQASEEEGDECSHPDEKRVSLSTPGDPNHWVCSVCRFDNKAQSEPMN